MEPPVTTESAADENPLVSVGIPVRNGGDAFPLALASVLEQTYTNLEILLSDNASDDGTSERCAAAAAADPRVRHRRHEPMIPALDNFLYAFEQTHGPFFLWAAHDDLRSRDYVEVLLRALQRQPDAGLAFGDLWVFHDYDDLAHAQPLDRIRGTDHGPFHDRALFPWRSSIPIYGLYRREILARYDGWHRREFGADMAIVSHMASASEIIHVPGTSFFYWGDDEEAAARRAQRARETAPTWRYVRLNWSVADAAARSAGRPRVSTFAMVHTTFWIWRLRGRLAARLPQGMVKTWRRRVDERRERQATTTRS